MLVGDRVRITLGHFDGHIATIYCENGYGYDVKVDGDENTYFFATDLLELIVERPKNEPLPLPG